MRQKWKYNKLEEKTKKYQTLITFTFQNFYKIINEDIIYLT